MDLPDFPPDVPRWRLLTFLCPCFSLRPNQMVGRHYADVVCRADYRYRVDVLWEGSCTTLEFRSNRLLENAFATHYDAVSQK